MEYVTVDQKELEHLKKLNDRLNAVRNEFDNFMEFSKSRAEKYTDEIITFLKFLKKLSNDIYELEIKIATHEKQVAKHRKKYQEKPKNLYD